MRNQTLSFRIHDPNTTEETKEYLTSIFADAMAKKVYDSIALQSKNKDEKNVMNK